MSTWFNRAWDFSGIFCQGVADGESGARIDYLQTRAKSSRKRPTHALSTDKRVSAAFFVLPKPFAKTKIRQIQEF